RIMKTIFISLILLLSTLASLIVAEPPFYGKGSSVHNLNANNFDSMVNGDDHNWLVEFYAPWCGHCKSLKPEYEKAATNLKGITKFAAVNCDEDANKDLCGRVHEIKGFPTIKFFPSKANAKGQKVAEEYQSGRSAKDFISFMTGRLPTYVEKLTEQSIDKFITSNKHAKAVLFTDKAKTSNLYKALSIDFHHSLPLGEIRTSSQEVLDKFKVKSMPTLVLFKSDSEDSAVQYDGKLDHDSITAFLQPFENVEAKPKRQQQKGGKDSKQQKPKEKEVPVEPALDHAVLIESQEQFDKYCANGLCSVSLFDFQNEDDKESNERYIEMLNKIAKKQAGRVKIVYMDGSIQANFIQAFDLSGLPNTFVININKMAYTPYLGSYTEEAIDDFLGNVLVGKKRAVTFKTVPKVVAKVTVSNEQPKPKAKGKDE
ncbi:hypothetical protein SAMD00019534_006010, partial [Acytostelium subglobosum LB1]|uniref:hypothetical protein n=1 Tax=Acytostelium subglobosum LB1 TaxID=1410327 RepID=UPI000644F4A5